MLALPRQSNQQSTIQRQFNHSSMETRLQMCRELFQALIAIKEANRAPPELSNALMVACQRLMLEAQCGLQQEAAVQDVTRLLELGLQLLTRVASLGPVEAFFTSDDLLQHYQQQLSAVVALTERLVSARQQQQQQQAHAPAAASGACNSAAEHSSGGASSSQHTSAQLRLPEQQQRIVAAFRSQAGRVCPLLPASLTADALAELCDCVRAGLLLVNGHRFLIGQEWRREVAAMLRRAEQLKVLMCHSRAHHLSLLAALLQLMHRQEVEQYDQPEQQQQQQQQQHQEQEDAAQPRGVPAGAVAAAYGCAQASAAAPAGAVYCKCCGRTVVVAANCSPSCCGDAGGGAAVVGGRQPAAISGTRLQAHIHVAAGTGEVLLPVAPQEDDEFYLPVAPLPAGDSSPAAGASPQPPLPPLPFDLSGEGSASPDMSDGCSLTRMPSSGCSSLLEFVQQGMSLKCGVADRDAAPCKQTGQLQHCCCCCSASHQQLRRITEEQLQSIAGPEAAPALAAALGVVLQPPSAAPAAGSCSDGEAECAATRCSSCSSPLSAVAEHATQALRVEADTSFSGSMLSTQEQHQHAWLRRHSASSGASSSSSAARLKALPAVLSLQHMQLPPGSCRSLGALLYVSPHICTLQLSDAGLDNDAEVVDLAECIQVNGSLLTLDLSHNRLEDIAARSLAHAITAGGSSSRLRVLRLQHNAIGDDGARALAAALSNSSCQIQQLWLGFNAIGVAGLLALAQAMQHNTSCTRLKLLPQQPQQCEADDADADAEGAAGDLTGQQQQQQQQRLAEVAKLAGKLARHNRGVRQRIKDLLNKLPGAAR